MSEKDISFDRPRMRKKLKMNKTEWERTTNETQFVWNRNKSEKRSNLFANEKVCTHKQGWERNDDWKVLRTKQVQTNKKEKGKINDHVWERNLEIVGTRIWTEVWLSKKRIKPRMNTYEKEKMYEHGSLSERLFKGGHGFKFRDLQFYNH